MEKDKVKKTAKFIVGWSSAFVVGNALSNNVRPKNSLQKAEVVIGSIAIGAVASDATEAWTDKMVDKLYVLFNTPDPNVTYLA